MFNPNMTPELTMSTNNARERIYQAGLRLFAQSGVTQVNVKQLAEAAGVARGTVYAHVGEPDKLFEELAARLAAEMNERISLSFQGVDDPAIRLANGIRLYVRRAHEEPHWGRFLARFGFSNPSLQALWNGPPVQDLMAGMQADRYRFQAAQIPSVLALVAGGVLGAILVVLEGHQTWRASGSDIAEMVLVALGVHPYEARSIANADLPALPRRAAS